MAKKKGAKMSIKKKGVKQKKIPSKLIAVALIIILLIAGFGLLYYYLSEESRRTDESLTALRSGDLEKGLELCNQIKVDQYSDVCYITYIGMKINNKEPYNKEICSKISERRSLEKEKLGCYV